MKKRLICLCLCFLICAGGLCSILTSCSAGQNGEKHYVYRIDDTKFNVIDPDGTSKFDIVRAENAPEVVLRACMRLRNAITEATGVTLEVKSDFEKAGHPEFQRQDYEILIGTTNRDESALAAEKLERAADFSVIQSGTRIAVLAKDAGCIDAAVDYFIENYIDSKNCAVALDPETDVFVPYDYPVDSFTINGVDAAEYAVLYEDDRFADSAAAIRSYVHDNYGYSIPVGKRAESPAGKYIFFQPSDEKYTPYYESLGALSVQTVVDDSGIALLCGQLVDSAQNADEFVAAYFNLEKAEKTMALTFETEEPRTIESEFIRADDQALLDEIDQKAAARRESIVNSPNQFTELPEGSTNKIYYISAEGDDNNDGLSEEAAWKTINHLNSTPMLPGDIVLFRRGDEFRGKITLKNGITYSAYGEGPKPIINGSTRNYASASMWKETDVENVYKSTYSLDNVGNIIFNYSGIVGNYDELIGKLEISGGPDGFTDYHDLDEDLEFCSDLTTKALYLYSAEGNPGDRFESIEIAEAGNIFQGSNPSVTVDNLMIIFGGSHGVGSGTVKERTVQNCIFAWIGGSILKGFNGGNITRFGNAVEVYGGCDGYYVYDNWIYQIYDTGVTHQYSNSDQIIQMKNIEYRGNLIELCHWSIEYYNRGEMPGSCLENVHVHDNMTLYGCYGWGSVGRESGGALHNSFTIIDEVTNYVVEDNIFAYSKGNIVRYNKGGDSKIQFRNNTYVQYYGRTFGYLLDRNEAFDGGVTRVITEILKDENPLIVFVMHDEEREAEEAAAAAAAAAAQAEADEKAEA